MLGILRFLLICALLSSPAVAGNISPHEMRGLRIFNNVGPLILNFSNVKSVTEDRTIVHFDVREFTGSTTGATLNLGIRNIDQGDPAGSLDVYAFAGDGSVSEDEWDIGSLFHTFSDIEGGSATLTVEISALLSSAVTNGDDYLSFNLRSVDPDRFSLNHTIDGVTKSFGSEGPTFINVVPEPSVLPSFILGGCILLCTCRQR